MKSIILTSIATFSLNMAAAENISFNFVNENMVRVIENYAKATGQKFIVDSTVNGTVSIINSEPVADDEAFNQMSEALALNGFAIVKGETGYVVRNARSALRDKMEVSTELPKAKPQRLATWVVNLKHRSPQDVLRELRMLSSSYGEMTADASSKQLIITDWTSSLQRIADIIKLTDKPSVVARINSDETAAPPEKEKVKKIEKKIKKSEVKKKKSDAKESP